jgi:hypothetical protein
LSNAVQHVAGQPSARPDAWIERVQRVAAHCTSIAQLLDCGRAAAWLSGLVQYRPAGLKAMQALPADLACLIADAPPGTSASQWASACQRLADDPWLTVAAALTDDGSPTAIALAETAGAFHGFGGLFRRPPMVSLHDGALLVDDGESEWGLLADAYGQYFHRTGAPRTVRKSRTRGDVAVDRSGRVRWGKMEGTFPFLGDAASIACDGMTLAVTIPTSHHVFLLARRGVAR